MVSAKILMQAALLLLIYGMKLKSAEGLFLSSVVRMGFDAQGTSDLCGDFLKYCKAPFKHSGGELRARCRTNQGDYVAADVNLDRYLSNVNGNLVLGTGYSKTCQDFGYTRVGRSEFLVTATCKKFDGQLRSTSYNVNSRVSSRNGVLRWDTGTCRRRSLLQFF